MSVCDNPAKRQPRGSRLLYICFRSPVPAKLGPARRNYTVIEQLARFFDLYVLSFGNEAEAKLFADSFRGRVQNSEFVPGCSTATRFAKKLWRTLTTRCDFVPVLAPNFRRTCSRLLRAEPFDAIFLSSVLLRGLPLSTSIPIVGDTHNVEFDVLRRASTLSDSFLRREYSRWQWRWTRREEQRCGNRVDLLLATSERDRDVFEHELHISNVTVVPNGIDLTEFSPSKEMSRPGEIVFTGLMSYYPNQQAISWFLKNVYPSILSEIPESRLVVVGASPPGWLTALAGPQIEVTGYVSDVRPYIARATVVIAPLLIGGGTRVKILEAQAMLKPVVATSLGAEGLNLRDGESVLLADDPATFANYVIELIRNPEMAESIAANGRQHVVEYFDWNTLGEHLSDVLRRRLGLVPKKQL